MVVEEGWSEIESKPIESWTDQKTKPQRKKKHQPVILINVFWALFVLNNPKTMHLLLGIIIRGLKVLIDI
jgi:hypothetical protein